VRLLSLGFNTTAADLYWLRLLQEVGGRGSPEQWRNVYPLVDLITDLDPPYGYAYEAGGTLLNTQGENQLADRILAKGMAAVPTRWQLPYLRGFLAWYEEHRWADAAPLLLTAARLPGSPRYLSELAARLFAQANSLDTGIAMLQSLAELDLPPETTERYRSLLQQLSVERTLREVDSALDVFRLRFGRNPGTLEELVSLIGLPQSEIADIEYDPATGTVRSAGMDGRLELSIPEMDFAVQPIQRGK